VKRGTLMIHIDPRIPRNNVEQAKANLQEARARLQTSGAQKDREEQLFKSQAVTKQEYEQAVLDYASANSGVVAAQVALQNAQITLDQTDVRAPITGTVIELDVERGQIISSPITAASGGTVLLKMADMNRVEVNTPVDETDIGKIQPGQSVSVTVDAFPNRPFQGTVLKIEPQATVQQNVTMFPVLIRIDNKEGLLKVGMNTEAEIHIGRRDSVLAIPNAALRTQKDVGSAALVLGLDPKAVQQQLAQSRQQGPVSGGDTARRSQTATGVAPSTTAGNTMTTQDGREIQLPAGVTEEQVRAIFAKVRNGEQPTAEETAILRKVRAAMGAGGGGARRGAGGGDSTQAARSRLQGSSYQFGGRYIVFTLKRGQPVPVQVQTGLTDLDYSEVVHGLSEGDSVLVLPSASLVQSQQDFKNRIGRLTGGGLPGVRSGQSQTPARGNN
jgi:HlyD family secretion protein